MCLCDIVFLSRYMRPEGPWQRRWLLLYTLFPCARTGLTGHSGPPTPPTVRKDKRKKKTPRPPPEGETKGKMHSRASLGPPPLLPHPPPIPWGHSPRSDAPHPRGAQKFQNGVRGPPLPQISHRRGSRPLPPQSLPNLVPLPSRLRSPFRALRKEMMPGLGLSAGPSPAIWRVCHTEAVAVGSRLRTPGQHLVVAPGESLFHSPQLGASNALPRRRSVASPRSHVLRDPICRCLGSGLRGDPRHMG